MKRTLFQILAVAAVGAMCSCSDFLDPYPSAIRSEEYILTNPTTMQGLIGKCYDYMAQNYNDNEGAYLDCATDNAVRTSTTDVLRRFAVGVTSPTNDPFETYWDRDYKGIYNVNMFLKDDRGLNMRYMLDEHLDELLRNRLWGEAYALRAWFQWDLLQKFGGRGTDGRLLGYPILLEPVRVWEMSPEEMRGLRFERNTYDECVAQILRDCDSAYKYLPIAHRDFLVPNADDRRVLGAQNWGRLDGISAVAIKALVYLTWASPRFNPDGDVERWRKAAECAKEVMDFKMTVDNVSGGFSVGRQVDWCDPNNPEIVYASRYKSSNDDMERAFYPGGFQGNGTMGATQELVDKTIDREELRLSLREVSDYERVMARIVTGTANCRDLVCLAQGASTLPAIHDRLHTLTAPLLQEIYAQLDPLQDLKELIEGAIDTLYYDGTMAQLSEKHFGSAADVDGVRNVTEKPVLDLSKLKTLKDGTLTVGVEVGYPPMEYTDDAGLEYQGFDIDFAKALGEVLGVDIEFVNTAWDGIFAGLDKEQYDVIISSVSITPERQAAYDLTEPYVSNQLVIVTLK